MNRLLLLFCQHWLLVALLCVSARLGYAQSSSSAAALDSVVLPSGYLSPTGDSIIRMPAMQKLTLTGYYRFFGYGRTLTEPYPNLNPFESAYGVGDGYREPMLSMLMIGRPNGKTSFMTELYMFTPYAGSYEENVFTMNLGLNFYGNFRTKHGRFGVRAGGIHWYSMSPFTMGIFQPFDLFSIFDRTPWEAVNNTEKYDNYYESGVVSLDTRWNNRAFQGLIVEGGALPHDFSFAMLFGKAQVNGGLPNATEDPLATIINQGVAGNRPTYLGFAGLNRVTPNTLSGFRLRKDFKQGFAAYNTLYNRTRLDSLKDLFQNYSVHTLEFGYQAGPVSISGELGAGSFNLPGREVTWGEVGMLRFQTPKSLTFLPFQLQFYHISKDFYNDNGEIQTFSNPEIQAQILGANQVGQPSAGGALTQVGQLVHNRRGVNLSTQGELGPFKIKLGWEISGEIDTLSNELSYIHRINGLALSRIYNPFPAGATGPTVVGPYQRVVTFFRGAYERVRLTDVDPGSLAPLTRKYFQAFDIQAKYRAELANRPLYVFYLGSFMAAQPELAFLPTFDAQKTYIQAQYHEFDLYYEVLPKFILTGYYGVEYIRGGINTAWDIESLQPRNQLGQGIGVGFDWTVAPNAAFYVRQRFMNFEDRSFALDKYRGHETTVELKVSF